MSRKNPYARPDARTREAKASGYPARSVFKLQEIDKRCQLLTKGARVLDLGAAPGSWSLYASERVGTAGCVVAVDLQKIRQAFADNVVVLQKDVFELGSGLEEHGPFDVILSDMAPATSGFQFTDQARSFELVMRALDLSLKLGHPRSHFVAKIFMSGDFPNAKRAVRAAYEQCRVIKPKSTRSNSSEVFLVGLNQTPKSEAGN